jgi:hypothetical protein
MGQTLFLRLDQVLWIENILSFVQVGVSRAEILHHETTLVCVTGLVDKLGVLNLA